MAEAVNPLLLDLALILITAGAVTILFKALKQPIVLGYIIAGVLIGPYVGFMPTATQIESVEFWGKIGVIFLLFGLGLEFSFKKLKSVGGPGAITVFTDAIMMFSMGFVVGNIFGWSITTCVFLGAMTTISSTSIIIKIFEALGLKSRKASQMVFGALICEDLVAILLLVLLPALVISKTFNGLELGRKILSIAVFLLLWFTGGIYFIPTLFKKLKKFLSDETLIVVALGLCLLMVVVTLNANISEALGAFVMGSILSGTSQRDKILRLIKPIRDFFGAIFFVSVGMLVDPAMLLRYLPHILIITAVIITAKPIAATCGFLFGGQPLRIALPAGMCLCQIGEFSYIIANLGRDLKATPDYLYPVIVAVSLLTTFVSPYWAKGGDAVYNFIYKRSSPGWRTVIDKLGSGKKTYNQESNWNKLLKDYLWRVILYSVWIAAIIVIFVTAVNPFIIRVLSTIIPNIGELFWPKILLFVITILFTSPFMWAMLHRRDKEGIYDKIWADRKFSRGPLLFMRVLRYFIVFIAVASVASIYLSNGGGALLLIGVIVTVVVVLSKQLKKYYSKIENQFLINLDTEGGRRFVVPGSMAEDIHIDSCTVGQNSFLAGKSIGRVHRAKNTGALVIQLTRGRQIFNLPSKEIIFYPGDFLLLLGSDAYIKAFSALAEDDNSEEPINEEDTIEMKLFQITLSKESPMIGYPANITQIKEKFGVLMVGVEKADSEDFLRPTSAVTIAEGDTVWIVGNKKRIATLTPEN